MSNIMLNENMFKVLSLFTSDYNVEIYGRETARELSMNQKTVANVLSRLEKENLLRSKTEGRNRIYRLNLLNPTLMHIISMVEEEKAARFRKESGLGSEFIDVLLKSGSPLVVVFGSYAVGSQKKDSDLDIMVLSPFDTDLSEVERFYGIKASIKEYTQEEFKDALAKGDFLIKEVLRYHVILLGSDLFVKTVMEAIHERG